MNNKYIANIEINLNTSENILETIGCFNGYSMLNARLHRMNSPHTESRHQAQLDFKIFLKCCILTDPHIQHAFIRGASFCQQGWKICLFKRKYWNTSRNQWIL